MVLMTEEELTKKYDIDEDRRSLIKDLVKRGVRSMFDDVWYTWIDYYKCNPESNKEPRDEDFFIYKEGYLTAIMHALQLFGQEYGYADEYFELLSGFYTHNKDKVEQIKKGLKEFKEQCLWDKEHGEESAED